MELLIRKIWINLSEFSFLIL